MGSEATINLVNKNIVHSDVYNELRYSLEHNHTVSTSAILSMSNLFLYGRDLLLTVIAEDPSTLLNALGYSLAAAALVALWYMFFWRPFDWNRDFTELGFDDVNTHYPNSNQTHNIARKNAINELRRRRKIGDMPPVYPNGWFIILETDQLPKRTTKEVNVLGLNLVAWRGDSGKSYVADAYCPHLGAHLGVGGKVNGECVVCPFHGWSFAGCDGKLTNIPYSDSVMDFAKIKMWETMEMNGFIYLWYHAEGEDPYWRPPVFPQIESGEWKYRGRSEFKVACHIQEMPENGADVSHLNIVHKPAMMTGGKPEGAVLQWGFFKHVWSASWAANDQPGEEYKALMKVHHHMSIFNKISLMKMDVEAHQVGPGLVFLEFNGFFGKGILFFMVTPLEPLLQRITHRFYSSNSMLHPFGMLILLGEAVQLERDIAIWNRKTYISRPLLTKEDKAIKSFRRWFNQFYSENSPKYSFSNTNSSIVDF